MIIPEMIVNLKYIQQWAQLKFDLTTLRTTLKQGERQRKKSIFYENEADYEKRRVAASKTLTYIKWIKSQKCFDKLRFNRGKNWVTVSAWYTRHSTCIEFSQLVYPSLVSLI